MPGLTVTEKEHWKDRIARRIDKKIESLTAEQPNLIDRINREARERALDSLGLSALQAELDRIERERETLQRRESQLEQEMLALVRGVPISDIDEYTTCRSQHEVASAVQRRQAVHEDELFAQHELGRRILQLRAERESLLDTVWLATSPQHIKTLWSKVAELLGDEQTPLQREALAIAPVEE